MQLPFFKSVTAPELVKQVKFARERLSEQNACFDIIDTAMLMMSAAMRIPSDDPNAEYLELPDRTWIGKDAQRRMSFISHSITDETRP